MILQNMMKVLRKPQADTDPLWGDVILLLTTTTSSLDDVSSYARTVTASGSPTPTKDTTIPLFGNNTYRLTGGQRFDLDITDAPLGTSEFTVECWIYATKADGGQWSSPGNSFYGNLSGTGPFTVGFSFFNIGGSSYTLDATNGMSASTWTHVCIMRDNTTDATLTFLRLYVDGVNITNQGGISKTASCGNTGFGWGLGWSTNDVRGAFGEYRITKAMRYPTSGFTPPSAPFPTQ